MARTQDGGDINTIGKEVVLNRMRQKSLWENHEQKGKVGGADIRVHTTVYGYGKCSKG